MIDEMKHYRPTIHGHLFMRLLVDNRMQCVFRTNLNSDGSFQRYKSRLVVKRFHHIPGSDYNKTFNQVVKSITISVIFTVALATDGLYNNLILIVLLSIVTWMKRLT